MEKECPQCHKIIIGPALRLVQDTCGHAKCRVCLLEDVDACKMCILRQRKELPPVRNEEAESVKPTISNKSAPNPSKTENVATTSHEHPTRSLSTTQRRPPNKFVLPSHIVLENSIYSCTFCTRTFKSKAHVKYHKYCVGGKRPYQCQTCQKDFISPSHLEMHEVVHTGKRPFVCLVCNKSFTQRSKLNRHEKLHSDTCEYSCTECDKSFKSRESLKAHEETHQAAKVHKCEVCDSTFSNLSNFKKHQLTHSKEKQHRCDKCGKSFKMKWTLIMHRRTHTTAKPYVCRTCNKSFAYSKDLKRHKEIHSEVKQFVCTPCGMEFRRKDNLERHLRNIHPGEPQDTASSARVTSESTSASDADEGVEPDVTADLIPAVVHTPTVIQDQPNAVNVIKPPQSSLVAQQSVVDNTVEDAPEPQQQNSNKTVMNGPPKLAFKPSSFKSHYNIQRDFESDAATDDTSKASTPSVVVASSPVICSAQPCQGQTLTPRPYETSFDEEKHAIIKNIKFKLPSKYMNLRSGAKPPVEIPPTEQVVRSAETSVIVNNCDSNKSSEINLHWRRRTSQHFQKKT